jgi:hypothetical protein
LPAAVVGTGAAVLAGVVLLLVAGAGVVAAAGVDVPGAALTGALDPFFG